MDDLDLGPPPPIHIPPLWPVAGASPPPPVAPGADGVAAPTPAPAPPKPPPPVTSSSQVSRTPATYTVKAGDTLGDIAARNGTSVSAILKANPSITNPNRISVGQVITLPAASTGGGGSSSPAPKPEQPKPEQPKPEQPAGSLIFPLWIKPTESWKDGARYFGAWRKEGRLHAGCDLYAPFGTPIRAIAAGTVIQNAYPFYDGTNALEVLHPGVGVVRYGEISSSKGCLVRGGDHVDVGQHIAYVGLLDSLQMHMLHFELYRESARGQALTTGTPPYFRNSAILNPTSLLDRLYHLTFG